MSKIIKKFDFLQSNSRDCKNIAYVVFKVVNTVKNYKNSFCEKSYQIDESKFNSVHFAHKDRRICYAALSDCRGNKKAPANFLAGGK